MKIDFRSLDSAGVNLQCRDREINERSYGLYILRPQSLKFQRSYPAFHHSVRLCIHASHHWSLSIHTMMRQNLKSPCLCAYREDLPCRYRGFTWELGSAWLVNKYTVPYHDGPLQAPSAGKRRNIFWSWMYETKILRRQVGTGPRKAQPHEYYFFLTYGLSVAPFTSTHIAGISNPFDFMRVD